MKHTRISVSDNRFASNVNKRILREANLNSDDNLASYETNNNDKEIVCFKEELSIKKQIHKYYDNGGTYHEKEIEFGKDVGKEI